ncbi:hypothetical protein [Bradyrhizobium ottawaense]|uniref:hypothetical protein n=1 Tax=Bradyrhizobium ottawaense TaxID=931866 RepID=UPI0035164548
MSDESKWPPLIGKQRIRYLCYRFGSVDGTLDGIANPFDRRRCEARIEYERDYARLWQNEATRDCESASDLEGAQLKAHHSIAELEAFHRQALKRPALLRSAGFRMFLEPFSEPLMPLDLYCTSPGHDKPRALRAILPKARKRRTALVWGASDENAKSVPAEFHDGYTEALKAEAEGLDDDLEQVARHYGSKTGKPADIPSENRATASRYWRRFMSRFEALCLYELELERIAVDEQMEREADEAAERKAEELVQSIERQIEDAAYAILDDVLAEQRATS